MRPGTEEVKGGVRPGGSDTGRRERWGGSKISGMGRAGRGGTVKERGRQGDSGLSGQG